MATAAVEDKNTASSSAVSPTNSIAGVSRNTLVCSRAGPNFGSNVRLGTRRLLQKTHRLALSLSHPLHPLSTLWMENSFFHSWITTASSKVELSMDSNFAVFHTVCSTFPVKVRDFVVRCAVARLISVERLLLKSRIPIFCTRNIIFDLGSQNFALGVSFLTLDPSQTSSFSMKKKYQVPSVHLPTPQPFFSSSSFIVLHRPSSSNKLVV